MYRGDRSRKETLVDYGFRLPSALDNRPLKFDEFEKHMQRSAVYVSATPGDYELEQDAGRRRRAGHPPDRPARSGDRGAPGRRPGRRPARRDPRCASHDERARARHHAHQAHGRGPDRVLRASSACACATCTPTSTRSSASRSCAICALGEFDVLVGINLLREGLDLPEVSLVAILDADKEGFLRCAALADPDHRPRRAQRRTAEVIMYADRDHRLDAARHRRDRPAPHDAGARTTRSTASRRRRSSARSSTSTRRAARRDYYAVPALRRQGGQSRRARVR